MAIDNKYFSFCKEIGIMKENYSQQTALNTLINAVKNKKGVDPEYVKKLSSLTLSSREVSVRSCVLYRYDIDVEYIQNGKKKQGNIYDFGHSGVHEHLKITEYKGEGEYTIIKSASQIPYSIFNSNNLFTYDEMKGALTKIVSKRVPSGTTSWESNNWSISAYIVPTLVIILEYNNKDYYLYYNLQNGCYHYEWRWDQKLLSNAKKAKQYSTLLSVVSIVICAIAAIVSLNAVSKGVIVLPIGLAIIYILIMKKFSKTKKQYEDLFFKKPETKLPTLLIKQFIMIAIALFVLLMVSNS